MSLLRLEVLISDDEIDAFVTFVDEKFGALNRHQSNLLLEIGNIKNYFSMTEYSKDFSCNYLSIFCIESKFNIIFSTLLNFKYNGDDHNKNIQLLKKFTKSLKFIHAKTIFDGSTYQHRSLIISKKAYMLHKEGFRFRNFLTPKVELLPADI